ncbi:hypothetical protein B0H67DRAFT_131965 [Lasiosphaeris hirsuta]|uniref:Uncharacterized protein n=1 Tax=Lasiosphaeris hirsuta TaxID=260670 RepID=A0AA40E2D6_9PEZI|nr:hypothetical protein B0H67DRAFT_131965 [Lasiosphaeris hirsuta]
MHHTCLHACSSVFRSSSLVDPPTTNLLTQANAQNTSGTSSLSLYIEMSIISRRDRETAPSIQILSPRSSSKANDFISPLPLQSVQPGFSKRYLTRAVRQVGSASQTPAPISKQRREHTTP